LCLTTKIIPAVKIIDATSTLNGPVPIEPFPDLYPSSSELFPLSDYDAISTSVDSDQDFSFCEDDSKVLNMEDEYGDFLNDVVQWL